MGGRGQGPAQAANPGKHRDQVWTRNPHRRPPPGPQRADVPFRLSREWGGAWTSLCGAVVGGEESLDEVQEALGLLEMRAVARAREKLPVRVG